MNESKEIFAQRLRNLIEEEGISQKQLAVEAEIAESSISKYLNCEAEPKLVPLVNIAKHFDVSIDYLLGVSNCKQYEENMQAATKVTGLSDDAIKYVKMYAERFGDFFEVVLKEPLLEHVLFRFHECIATEESILKDKYIDDYIEKMANGELPSNRAEWAQLYCKCRNRKQKQTKDNNARMLALFGLSNAVSDLAKKCSKPIAETKTKDVYCVVEAKKRLSEFKNNPRYKYLFVRKKKENGK